MSPTNGSRFCDFHTHTVYSDGSLTPEQLVRDAKKVGLAVVAITDHDITDGVPAAEAEGKRVGVEVVPGVELSALVTNASGVETEMHILGYFLRYQDARFQETLALFRRTRLKRAEHMIAKLAHLGMKLDAKKIKEHAQGGAVGRPHIARAMVEAGFVSSFDDAFHKYLKEGRPGYVAKAAMTPAECVQLIRRVGGLAVAAHPHFGGPRRRKSWQALVEIGLNGIEAHHSQQPSHATKECEKVAREFGLIITGGSDFHSYENGPKGSLGDIRMPYSALEAMREKKAQLDKEAVTILQKH